MGRKREMPARFYKYKKFDARTLELLITDSLYFADPTTFNDPFDTRPSIDADVGAEVLEGILRRFVEQRLHAEMSAAARSIKYKGPKTLDHITRQSRQQAERLISEIAYNATNPDYETADAHSYLLVAYLEEELLKRYDKGIVSFAERADCPLMWSHYGDQHRGLCIGYSLRAGQPSAPQQVEYEGGRLVLASDVSRMLDGDPLAQQRVDQAVLLRKAPPWNYEGEWRLIGERGTQDSPLEMEEVVFGVRCNSTAVFAVVKAFEDRARPVKFCQMRQVSGTFELTKSDLDMEQELATWPRRAVSAFEEFEALQDTDQSEPPIS